MKNNRIIFILLLITIHKILPAQPAPFIKGYAILDSTSGDLDKDDIPELVIAFTPDDSNDSLHVTPKRLLYVYKKQNRKWLLWQQSTEALLGEEEGGMMGDPYSGIYIKNGVLYIEHFGGSNWKWRTTDKYKLFNNQFRLIGVFSYYGKQCEHWASFDFNLLSGKINYRKNCEHCKDQESDECINQKETFYYKGIRINFATRRHKAYSIVSPRHKDILSL